MIEFIGELLKQNGSYGMHLYIKIQNEYSKTFSHVLNYMNDNNIKLAGAVFDYNCPEENGQLYLFFPIKRL